MIKAIEDGEYGSQDCCIPLDGINLRLRTCLHQVVSHATRLAEQRSEYGSQVDSSQPITVRTQFITNDGADTGRLTEVKQSTRFQTGAWENQRELDNRRAPGAT